MNRSNVRDHLTEKDWWDIGYWLDGWPKRSTVAPLRALSIELGARAYGALTGRRAHG